MSRPFSPEFILTVLPKLFPYLFVTLGITLGTILGGSLIGAVVAKGKLGKNPVLKGIAEVYTYTIRSTPSIVLLFIVYYGLPESLQQLAGINCNTMSKGIFVLITFIILFSANMSEIMRSAYLAIDQGQYEAGVSAGLSGFWTVVRIILPQSAVVALPNFANAVIGLIKEGALAYTIGFVDIMGKGNLIIGNNYGAYALETYLAMALLYWGVVVLVEKSFLMVEGKLSAGRRAAA